ncbi:MAG: EamA family transporter, partial [Mangrovicoccus sp.]
SLVVLDGVDLPGLGWAILSGAVTSGLCYALWYSLLPQLPAAVAAVAQLSVPPIAMFGGVVLLAEVLTGRAVAASLVILAAVALAVIPARPNAKPATRP